jgi:hypothetical protein
MKNLFLKCADFAARHLFISMLITIFIAMALCSGLAKMYAGH